MWAVTHHALSMSGMYVPHQIHSHPSKATVLSNSVTVHASCEPAYESYPEQLVSMEVCVSDTACMCTYHKGPFATAEKDIL